MINNKANWIFCLIGVFSTIIANAQLIDSNTINWNENRKMHYGDYKVLMPADSMRDGDGNWIGFAATMVLINKNFQRQEDYLQYDIYAYVDMSRSYIKPDTFLGDYLEYALDHEQIHFDISELYARKMRQFIVLNGENCNEHYIEYALDSINSQQWNEQKSFDSQSFSNELVQNYWKNDIRKQLAVLAKYKRRAGRVKCKK